MTKKYDLVRDLVLNRNLLVHASPRDDLRILAPRTGTTRHGRTSHFLYATSCPVYAIAHGIRKQMPGACILNRYRCAGASFVFCSILQEKAPEVLSLETTLHFCERASFAKVRRVTRLERWSLGLVRNTFDTWISPHAVEPVFKLRVSLSDLDCTKRLHEDGESRIRTLLRGRRVGP